MSMVGLAMLLQQEVDPSGTRHLIAILLIVFAVCFAALVAVLIYVALKSLKAIQELSATALELKTKALPVMEEVQGVTKNIRAIIEDATPKVKRIGENLVKTSESVVETSYIAKGAVQKFEATLTDANLRTQRQVARVDGMVSSALTTTQEVADTIANGIRVPAMKIAEMMHGAKTMVEGVLAKVKSGTRSHVG